jgi:hypothetical protein
MLRINPGAASAAMNAGSAAKAEPSSWKPDPSHIKGSRKKRVTGLAGKARHQGSPQGFGPHHAIIRKGLDRGSCGSRGHSRQSRHITAPGLAAQQGIAPQASAFYSGSGRSPVSDATLAAPPAGNRSGRSFGIAGVLRGD